MSSIRPDLPAVQPPTTPAPVRAAQAAFFRAALDQAVTSAPAQAGRTTTGPAPSPEAPRASRPGALLDIRV
jgi:hypothetical protein